VAVSLHLVRHRPAADHPGVLSGYLLHELDGLPHHLAGVGGTAPRFRWLIESRFGALIEWLCGLCLVLVLTECKRDYTRSNYSSFSPFCQGPSEIITGCPSSRGTECGRGHCSNAPVSSIISDISDAIEPALIILSQVFLMGICSSHILLAERIAVLSAIAH
jgi:hypothetical protein